MLKNLNRWLGRLAVFLVVFIGPQVYVPQAYSQQVYDQQVYDQQGPTELGVKTAEGSTLCPAISCDCNAITLPKWRERCQAAELKNKQDCAQNQGVPRQYCTLHGPKGVPIAINAIKPEVASVTQEALENYKRQVVMLIWAIQEDLDNIQAREQRQLFSEAMQVHRLLDQNIERLFLAQASAAEGERTRVGPQAAANVWREYREELTAIIIAFNAYKDMLWVNHNKAGEAVSQKAYRVLAMRMGRSASTLSEHYALAYVGEGDERGAALAWAKAAREAASLATKEQLTTNHSKRIAFYSNEAAARWYRAAFYWMQLGEENSIANSLLQAEQGLLP